MTLERCLHTASRFWSINSISQQASEEFGIHISRLFSSELVGNLLAAMKRDPQSWLSSKIIFTNGSVLMTKLPAHY
jgi:hypothetical protein